MVVELDSSLSITILPQTGENVSYVKTNLEKLEKLNLTLNEYAIADLISNLCTNPKNSQGGWCYASRKTLGKPFHISERAVFNILNRLILLGIIEKHSETKNLKPTSKWDVCKNDIEYAECAVPMQNVHTSYAECAVGKNQNRAQSYAESAYNNIDNKSNKEILDTFNTVFLSRYRSTRLIEKNAALWLETYSIDEIKEAIVSAAKDDFCKDKITPEILFRQKDKEGNPCDRIGDILRKAEKPVEFKMIGGQNDQN